MFKKTYRTAVVIVGGGVTTWGVIRGLKSNIPIYVVSRNPKEPWLKSRFIQNTFILNPNSQDYISS